MMELRTRGGAGRAWLSAVASTAAIVGAVVFISLGVGAYDALRERAFDAMLDRLIAAPRDDRVRVVDIDRPALDRLGPWPWGRDQLAEVIGEVVSAGAAAVALDILIEGPDERSPVALARRLAELTQSPGALALADGLPDSDEKLAAAIRGKPVVLGLALDPDRPGETPPPTPILVQGQSELGGIWQAVGVAGPPDMIAEAAGGLGVLALAGDADGRVRRVPLLTAAAGQLKPGLAAETVRALEQASAFVVARGNTLRIGGHAVPFAADATLRLMPQRQPAMAARTVSAGDLAAPLARNALRDRVVLIGSSLPELGGLRLAAAGALVPSVQLQAGAIAQLIARIHPIRPLWIDGVEIAGIVLAGLTGLLGALGLSVMRGGLATAGLAIAWLAASAVSLRSAQVLLDPIAVPLTLAASFAVAALIVAADTWRREAALRRRFEQHLAPELVSRIVENPALLKLAGETREVTILFTDVEGFTAMTERSDPATLIRVLDRYIEEMSAIIVAHGGMVEKIVGDGFHGLFNAPLDLDAHADKAVACALAIKAFSERFAADAEPRALGFGRTRVGIETGPVIVGDVGGGERLDYTAYGNAMNTAARLEAANKDLGSAICIGPTTASQLSDRAQLRPLGRLEVRGRSVPMEVFDIWPGDMPQADRTEFLAAMALAELQTVEASRRMRDLASRHPRDGALVGLAGRLASGAR